MRERAEAQAKKDVSVPSLLSAAICRQFEQAEIETAKAKRATSEKFRREKTKNALKRNERGQPVMKHQIASILAKISG